MAAWEILLQAATVGLIFLAATELAFRQRHWGKVLTVLVLASRLHQALVAFSVYRQPRGLSELYLGSLIPGIKPEDLLTGLGMNHVQALPID